MIKKTKFKFYLQIDNGYIEVMLGHKPNLGLLNANNFWKSDNGWIVENSYNSCEISLPKFNGYDHLQFEEQLILETRKDGEVYERWIMKDVNIEIQDGGTLLENDNYIDFTSLLLSPTRTEYECLKKL